MKTTQHIRRLFPSLLLLGLFFTASCKQVSQAIDNLLTFSITKTAPPIPIPALTPIGMTFAAPGVPIGIDSATLAQQKTSLSLVRTLKLTDMTIAIDDSVAFPRTNIDTMTLSVGLDSLHQTLLATYVGTGDKKTLTNADFAADAKNPNDKFYVTFRLKSDPPHTVNLLTSYKLTFSADPLP
ncbi:MAG: hypothetical protein Q8896_07700 [Bacteroidota bacterium]|nr:hypothetical protein [Bacteroidota bacterium]